MKSLVLMIASLSIVGCTAEARSPEPVPVDKVECARCRMIVSTDVGAGEIVSTRDDTRFYDDVGCLIADWKAHATDATPFVRLSGGGWIDARAAWFARPVSARTAMGSGLAAYATEEDAKAADRDRRALPWQEVLR